MIENRPTKKKIYFWNLLGNLAAAAVSVVYLLIVTRLQPAEVADHYSLATSVGNLWVIIGLFQVRNYQSTDINQTHSFTAYFSTRLLTISFMLLTIVPYLLMIDYDLSVLSLAIVILLILYRVSDALSDVFQGLFQQVDRLDIAGKSMFYRYGLSVIILFASLLITKSIILALSLVALFNFFFVLVYDYSHSLKITTINWSSIFSKDNFLECRKILELCLPLFFYGFLLTQIFNEPRLVIASEMKQGILAEGLQRDYNILFMPVFFMNLCFMVIRPLITDLAKLWSIRKFKKFDQILLKVLLVLLGGGLLITALAYLCGIPVLEMVFGVDLSNYTLTLTLLVFSGILYAIATFFENILTIFRKHFYLAIVYIAMFAISKLITSGQVQSQGLLGAAISFFIVMLTYVTGNGLMYLFARYRKRMKNE